MSRRQFNNTPVIVTGASGGVGEATCRLLAADGAQICLVGRTANKLQALAEELNAATDTLICCGDVGDADFCEDACRRCQEHYDAAPSLLVNNAGVMRRGTVTETSNADWSLLMRTNVDAVFYMSRAMARQRRAHGGGGAIVNVGSTLSLVAAPGLTAYCTSKGAVAQLTRALALDLAPDNITVNAVCPGAIDSPMLYSEHPPATTIEAVQERNKKGIPLAAIATPMDVARAILYLAGEPHITGTLLSVDGGYTAQ